MKKSMKKAVSIILCVIMLCGCVLTAGAEGKVKVNLFNKDVDFPEGYGAPFIDRATSRTLVPARGVFEAMQAEVSWDGTTRTVYIYKGEDKIEIVIDSLTAKKNGTEITLDQAAVIVADRTYVPLRFVAESLNLDVSFDEKTTTVIIKEKAPEAKEFAAGKYEVGKDLKGTEYLLVADGDAEVKLLRGADSANSENVISTIPFKTSIYLNVVGSMYVETTNCKMFPVSAVTSRIQNGEYKNGMFKVGTDIDAGNYSVNKVVSAQTGTYKVFSKAYSTEGTMTAVSSGTVTKAATITLKAGQYILLDNVKLVKQTVSPGATGGGGGSGGGGGRKPGSSGSEVRPSEKPSETPSEEPSETPSEEPSETPSEEPSETPSEEPSEEPTDEPVISENIYYENTEDLIIDFGNYHGVPVKEIVEGDNYIIYCYDGEGFVDEDGNIDRAAIYHYWKDFQIYNTGFEMNGSTYHHPATGIKATLESTKTTIRIRIDFGKPNKEMQEELEQGNLE